MSWMLPLLTILFFLFLWFCFQICVFGWWIIAVVVLEVVVWWGYDLMVYWVKCGVGFARLLGFFFFLVDFFFLSNMGFFYRTRQKREGWSCRERKPRLKIEVAFWCLLMFVNAKKNHWNWNFLWQKFMGFSYLLSKRWCLWMLISKKKMKELQFSESSTNENLVEYGN